MGTNQLFRPWHYEFQLADVQKWCDNASLAIDWISQRRRWQAIVMSASVLPSHRFVYWDIVNGANKWQIPAAPRRAASLEN